MLEWVKQTCRSISIARSGHKSLINQTTETFRATVYNSCDFQESDMPGNTSRWILCYSYDMLWHAMTSIPRETGTSCKGWPRLMDLAKCQHTTDENHRFEHFCVEVVELLSKLFIVFQHQTLQEKNTFKNIIPYGSVDSVDSKWLM